MPQEVLEPPCILLLGMAAKGMGDVRTVSGEFLLSLQGLWRRRGDEILERVADQFPELLFSGMIKLSRVLKVEVGGPDDFAKLGKQAILEKLQKKGGPEARQLFEEFMRDVEKLQAQEWWPPFWRPSWTPSLTPSPISLRYETSVRSRFRANSKPSPGNSAPQRVSPASGASRQGAGSARISRQIRSSSHMNAG
jgi:hypothetical protein